MRLTRLWKSWTGSIEPDMTPEHYCQEKAAPVGSNFYYAALFHSAPQKRSLHALFALQQELIDTVIECQDAGVARIKLQWWSEEIRRLFANEARHPVSKALQALQPELKLEQSSLLSMIMTNADAINPAQAESLEQLIEDKCRQLGACWQMAARACHYDDTQTSEFVVKIAGLCGALDHFQLARQHLNRGYSPFPRLEMEALGLNDNDLLCANKSASQRKLLTGLFTSLHRALVPYVTNLSDKEQPSILFARVMARITQTNCTLLQKQSELIPSQALLLTPLRKLWIAWRTK